MGEKCVWIGLVESASKRKLKCLALHTFFNTSIAVLMQRETAVAFHVLLSAVCLPYIHSISVQDLANPEESSLDSFASHAATLGEAVLGFSEFQDLESHQAVLS